MMLNKYYYTVCVPNHRKLLFKEQERNIKNANKIQNNNVNIPQKITMEVGKVTETGLT